MSDAEWGSPAKRYTAYGLMVLGGLIAVLSGGCTVIFLLILSGEGALAVPDALAILAVGGIPCAVGIGVFFVGWWIRRRGLAASGAESTDSGSSQHG